MPLSAVSSVFLQLRSSLSFPLFHLARLWNDMEDQADAKYPDAQQDSLAFPHKHLRAPLPVSYTHLTLPTNSRV